MSSCQNSLGHVDCGLTFITLEHEGHKAAPDAWKNTKNKALYRKWAREHGELSTGPVLNFKKGKR